ncbi:MAG: hypothetical protein Q4C47_04965, partial [Planctomycetia bacterium]|nr:hypothetical protein [Planctomycetia bacterium]
ELLLPERMEDARFMVPGLRHCAIKPIEETRNIRVRLELQDAVMGKVRVLIENDLPLTGEVRDVIFPELITPVRTIRRFAMIENSGRDEMIVTGKEGMTPVDRRQESWTLLTSMLGSEPTGAEAFEVTPQDGGENKENGEKDGKETGVEDETHNVNKTPLMNRISNETTGAMGSENPADGETTVEKERSPDRDAPKRGIANTGVMNGAKPRLRIATRRREQAEWIDARIGLSETSLIVDKFGEYRARQIWSIDNSTRPLLEVELPENATLWGVTVAGKPVRPIAGERSESSGDGPEATGSRVRIPLVKTSRGDPDYEVVAIYAGKLAPIRPGLPLIRIGERVAFPLIQVHGIEVRRSNLKLFLPEKVTWFDFDGTLGKVDSEEELVAQRIEYDTDQLLRLIRIRRESGDPLTQIRAEENLKMLAPQNDYSSGNASGGSFGGGYRGRYYGSEYEDGADLPTGTDPEVREKDGSNVDISSGEILKGVSLVRKAIGNNRTVVSQVEQELESARETTVQTPTTEYDNRAKFHEAFTKQSVQRSRNVVRELAPRFQEADPGTPGTDTRSGPGRPEESDGMTPSARETHSWMERFSLGTTSQSTTSTTNGENTRELSEGFQVGISADHLAEHSDENRDMAKKSEMTVPVMRDGTMVPEGGRLAKSESRSDPSQIFQRQRGTDELRSDTEIVPEINDREARAAAEELERTQRYREMVQRRAVLSQRSNVGNLNRSGDEKSVMTGKPMAGMEATSEAISGDDPGAFSASPLVPAPAQTPVSAPGESGLAAPPRESIQTPTLPNGMAGSGGMGGMGGGMGMAGGLGGGMGVTGEKTSAEPAVTAKEDVTIEATGTTSGTVTSENSVYGRSSEIPASRGLVSLMIGWDESKLAKDSQILYFTTPGGDLELTAKACPEWPGIAPDALAGKPVRAVRGIFWFLFAVTLGHVWYRRRRTVRGM